jgi:glycosyltransferase involved in cell wall biosynthesis
MKCVIMIAYYFPPEGSAGSYRPLRFVRHLSKMGWCTSVITADPYGYERYDADLLGLVPNETEIVRVRGRDPWQAIQTWRGERIQEKLSAASAEIADQIREAHYRPVRTRLREAVRRVEARYYQPDIARPWIRPAAQSTVNLSARKRPDVIWATAGPISAWIVAQRASKITGVPYVLDLRDPHGLSYYEPEAQRPKWVNRKLKNTMHQLFKGAHSVVFLFDIVAESYYRAFPEALEPCKIHIIPNGYEGTTEEFVLPNVNKFTLLYTGTLSSYRYDTLLKALVIFKNTAAAKARTLRLVFVGEGMHELTKQAARLGLSDIVETIGPRPHAEILLLQREAHALLILGRLSTIKGHELFAGAKLFAYLKAARPIFGVLPQDETKKILHRVGVSTVASVDSPLEILAVLRKLLNAWSEGTLASLLPDRAECQYYSAERQTEALVCALEGAPATEPFVPGSVEIAASLQEDLIARPDYSQTKKNPNTLYSQG